MRLAVIATALATVLAAGTATAVTEQNFLLKTTGDLAALCGVSKDDPDAIAAIHFCHGYALGLDHYGAATGRVFRDKLYCIPEGTTVTRNQFIEMFVKWATDHPQYMSEPPFDGLIRFAMDTWPCPKAAETQIPSSKAAATQTKPSKGAKTQTQPSGVK
ncbi:MAG: Rap1a/Tai family immunity protein [Candidatus Competibacteraceae bacterium]